MMDLDKRAHDLAMLYMQIELSEGQLTTRLDDDFEDFVNEYNHLYTNIKKQLNSRSF